MWFGGDGVEPTAVESRLASTVMSIFLGERLWLSLSEEWTLIWLSSLKGERGTTCRASSRCRNERAHALVVASVAIGGHSYSTTESVELLPRLDVGAAMDGGCGRGVLKPLNVPNVSSGAKQY